MGKWWISQSSFTNEKQRVDIKKESNGVIFSHHSNLVELERRILQGSILVPVFFLIYINTLSTMISKWLAILFAEDNALLCSGHNKGTLEVDAKYSAAEFFNQ